MERSITRRNCRDASRCSRLGLPWQTTGPLAQAYLPFLAEQDYRKVFITENKMILSNRHGYREEYYLTRRQADIVKEIDNFIATNGWGANKSGIKNFNADALYNHLAEREMLTFQVREEAVA